MMHIPHKMIGLALHRSKAAHLPHEPAHCLSLCLQILQAKYEQDHAAYPLLGSLFEC